MPCLDNSEVCQDGVSIFSTYYFAVGFPKITKLYKTVKVCFYSKSENVVAIIIKP